MNNHDATETAYRNGYEAGVTKGKEDAVKHGEWEITEDDWHSLTLMKCSVCGEEWCFEFDETGFLHYNYCPHCGAKMDGGKET